MMRMKGASKTTFQFLYAQLLVKRVKPDFVTTLAHIATLNTGAVARYNMTRVELKSFTFSARLKIPVYRQRRLGSRAEMSPLLHG